MSIWEIIGTVLGLIGVGLMIRQNIWGWPVGLMQVAVYAWVFLDVKLYSDAILQVFFFGILAYGWWHWVRNRHTGAHSELPVACLQPVGRIGFAAAGTVVAGGWGFLMARQTDASYPFWDAFILVFSLIAQWLQARKNLECWAGWMIVNTVAIGVYWAKDLRLTSGLYTVFFGMAVAGHLAWRKSMRAVA
ncbi:MAG: nicotinamide mononucleotide transporter [Opitutae bacterium]|nr:nicotinamide mononucleotide transporter [Opitutae bacterium]